MMLGHFLRNLADDAAAEEALFALGDLVLLAAVEEECAVQAEARGEYVAGAVRRFARMAGDGDWLAVMGKLERSDRPAADFLRQTLEWTLKRDRAERIAAPALASGCTCGGSHGHEPAAR